MTSSNAIVCRRRLRTKMIREDKLLICEWRYWEALRNALYKFQTYLLTYLLIYLLTYLLISGNVKCFYAEKFSGCVKSAVFWFCVVACIHITHAWWSETFWFCEVQTSFLVNWVQKLSKLVMICESYCKSLLLHVIDHSLYITGQQCPRQYCLRIQDYDSAGTLNLGCFRLYWIKYLIDTCAESLNVNHKNV